MPTTSPDIAAVLNDDSSVDSTSHVEMLELEGEIWFDHQNVVNDFVQDCYSVSPNVVEPKPDPSPPVIASEGDDYNHCKDPISSY